MMQNQEQKKGKTLEWAEGYIFKKMVHLPR